MEEKEFNEIVAKELGDDIAENRHTFFRIKRMFHKGNSITNKQNDFWLFPVTQKFYIESDIEKIKKHGDYAFDDWKERGGRMDTPFEYSAIDAFVYELEKEYFERHKNDNDEEINKKYKEFQKDKKAEKDYNDYVKNKRY